MDGSLETFYPYWDETFNMNRAAGAWSNRGGGAGGMFGGGGSSTVSPMPMMMASHPQGAAGAMSGGFGLPDDLWATMTMGWAHGGGGDGGFEGA